MRVPKFLGVGKQIQKVLNLFLAIILSSSSLAVAAPLLLTQKAYAAPAISIVEFMANPSAVSDANGEWVEVQNNTGTSLNLSGYKLNGDAIIGTTTIANGDSAVICSNGDTTANGGVACDYTDTSMQLANTGDTIKIKDGQNNIIDSVSYSAVTAGKSQKLDGASWVTETSYRYGDGDYGTPSGDTVLNSTTSWYYPSITSAISAANAGNTIKLTSNVVTSSAVTIDQSLTLDGDGFTLGPEFAKTDSSNNAAIGIEHSDVSIENLIIDGANGTSLHGMNVYASTGVNLENVTILHNDHAALVVNGSTVTADNLVTSDNTWGAVNVDPGSGVTEPSVFNLNSGSLAESTQIWSDGSHVSSGATVLVNAPGYDRYKLAGTSASFVWTNRALTNAATVTDGGITTLYPSIQSAIDDASLGSTINVATGDYSGEGTLDLDRAVNLVGPSATISDVSITASDVKINGFTFNKAGIQVNITSSSALSGLEIRNNTFSGYAGTALTAYDAGNILIQNNTFTSPASSAEAIQLRASVVQGGCSGSQILGNVFDGATTNGAADVNMSCTGSNSTNILVSDNLSTGISGGSSFTAFSGVNDGISISNNTASTDGSTVFFFGNVSGSALIDGNVFSSSLGSAVSIHGGDITSDSTNSGIFTITNNDLSDSTHSISVATGSLSGQVIAHGNDLSGDSGPAITNSSTPVVDASSNWWGNALGPIASQYSGNVTTSPWCSARDCSVTQTASSGTTSLPVGPIASPTTIGDTDIITIPATNDVVATTSTSLGTVQVTIPKGTTITAPAADNWDGSITAPTVTSVNLGSDRSVSLAIEVGAGSTALTFDKGVRLVLPGQAGKSVGFVRGSAFTPITDTCTADSQLVGNALTAGGNCYITVGSDLVIWTKHFTTFVAYSQTTSQGTPGSNGIGSTSSNNSGNSNSTSSPKASFAAGSDSATEVLGASSDKTSDAHALSTKTTQPSNALTFQAPAKSGGKFLGIAWYIWLIGVAALAVAGYLAYAYRSLDRN